MCGKMTTVFLQITKFDHLRIHTQKPSLFTTILDMAALEKTGSRAGSLSLENENVSSQTHLLYNHQNGEVDHNKLTTLARRSTMRKRSFR